MAQPMFFLKLDGIPGASADAKHKGEIELTEANTSGMSLNGQSRMESLGCVAIDSFAQPKLWKAMLERQTIKQGVLTSRASASDQHEYSVMTFSDARIASLSVSMTKQKPKDGESGGTPKIMPNATLHFTVAFSKFEVQIKEIKSDGTLGSPVKYGFDLNAGQPV